MSENQIDIQRRQFFLRAGKAAISIAGVGAAAYLISKKPQDGTKIENLISLPDFSMPVKAGQTMSIIRGSDRVKNVDKAIELLGGIKRFIKEGDRVLIKPNIAFASPAMLGATTHPELIAEVARLCYSQGHAKEVFVADNPINDPASCFSLSGIGKAATSAGAKIVLPKDNMFKNMTLPGGKLIKDWPVFHGAFANVNKVIGIAPVKNHSRSGASMTMKNWYGLLGGRRNIFHQDIHTIITELSMMIKPTLVILDGTEVMMTNGPTGGSVSDLKRCDTLIASCDMVAADSFGCTLLGMEPKDLPYLSMAQKAGVGTTDYQSLKPLTA